MGSRANSRTTAVKLISGVLYPVNSPELFEWTSARLSETFGDIERTSEAYTFDCTDYYMDISSNLARRFFSFKGLRHPLGLVAWKKLAISLEAESSPESACRRRVNIDPGYVDGARIILASTKDHAHRIYLHDDIYAEVTMCRRKFGWESFSYTFPDFASGIYDAFLDAVRCDWKRDVRFLKQSEAG
ncbi:MAG: DUF4416 family protein [Synergistaceae bacterium]|jgi:hypothetical protein|nr:DUF4416 family protein [Synergistaceae bacterium]